MSAGVDDVAAAYTATGSAWQRGPGRVYDRLATTVVAHACVDLAGRSVLDVGAGTGAASRAAIAAGARAVVAVDVALGMLRHDAARRPPSAVADAARLPFPSGCFDASVAAFSLNHLPNPAAGVRELARVTAPGGPVVVSAYALDDTHPVKTAVEEALRGRGWRPARWYDRLRTRATPRLATVDRAAAEAAAAGLDATAAEVRIAFPDLAPVDLVEWRLGMAQHAPFVAQLRPAQRSAVITEAVGRLGGDPPPLVRSIIVLTAVAT